MDLDLRAKVLAALARYGASLTDDDRIVRGEKVSGVRVTVKRQRVRMVSTAGALLASGPVSLLGAQDVHRETTCPIGTFVESFWFWTRIE